MKSQYVTSSSLDWWCCASACGCGNPDEPDGPPAIVHKPNAGKYSPANPDDVCECTRCGATVTRRDAEAFYDGAS